MLTDVVIEEDFELRGEDLWYSKQDLENDLHLAAELGKTLLDRNHELEQSLQQMYTNNQEQLQEIEYLTKQMDVLRQMNEQHAKVYEQLDGVARELEQGNCKLMQDNRAAQQRIQSLTETVDTLQAHMDELQEQVEQLSAAQSERSRREKAQLQQRRTSLSAQSVPCLKELYDLHQDKCLMSTDVLACERPWVLQPEEQTAAAEAEEEERAALCGLVQTLEAQLEVERSRRHEAEQEAEATAEENSMLGQRLAALDGCRIRQAELEAEVEELRQLWRSEMASARRAQQRALHDDVSLSADGQPGGEHERGEELEEEEEEQEEEEQDEGEEVVEEEERGEGKPRARCQSEGAIQGASGEELRRRHRPTCARRPRALLTRRGVSLLSEVDAQYSALQRQYDELLRRSQHSAAAGGPLSHKAVQTPAGGGSCPIYAHAAAHAAAHAPRRRLSSSASGEPPEYKALFMEIFNCIQKTKGDLSDTSVQALHRMQTRRLSQSIQTDETP
ncbi:cerebellar degeneration-related protein 2 [Alosa sapidissima]|uniref:cerebellar degeneration-related protein 2 n=1 Tax=Alosa sapidissima TaxID=34773 RepID=UPI001C07FCA2|nr:cerebellar degeneration-related protein 2 [Alosa sapidissima]